MTPATQSTSLASAAQPAVVNLGNGPGGLPASVTLAASSATIDQGGNEMLTALVNGGEAGTPTGSIQFFDSTPSGTAELGTANLVNGIAVFETDSLATGTNSIDAIYTGDYTFSGTTTQTNTATTVNVLQVAAPVLTPAANPVAAATSGDTSVSITAYLPAGATGTGSASGSVEFNVNGTAASSSPLAPLTANALQFSGSSSSYLAASSNSTGLPSGTQARTISTWFNPASRRRFRPSRNPGLWQYEPLPESFTGSPREWSPATRKSRLAPAGRPRPLRQL